MAMDIINLKKDELNGLLSKIKINDTTHEIKDLVARENIEALAAIVDAINYIENTGVYADDAAIKAAIDVKADKNYVDAQIGAINKFDVVVGVRGDNGEPNVAASAETMYKLYLIPDEDAASGTYVEFITIRSGEEGAYTYDWEAIGSTAMDLTGFVTEGALSEALEPYAKSADLGDLAGKDESELNLKALAHKDNATGTVEGQTISGVKATGTSTGSIDVVLTEGSAEITSNGAYTPAGSVNGGKVTATGSIDITVTNADAQAVLGTADYQPAGEVKVTPATADVNVVKSAGTAASFVEGTFTPATLTREDVTGEFAKEGLVGEVKDECLTFTAAGLEAITATKVNGFTGGSKAADSFTANVPAEIEPKTLATGIASAEFTGTVAAGLKVTSVTYKKHDSASATFTGDEVDVTGASFSGNAATIEVKGNGKTYAVDAENTKFNGAAIELAVGDIAVAAKSVTVQ